MKLIWLRIEHSSSSIFSGKILVNLTLQNMRGEFESLLERPMAASPQTDSSERKNVSEQKMGCAAAWYFSCTTSMPSVEVLPSSSKIESKFFEYYKKARYRPSSSASVVSNGSKNWKFLKSNFTFFFFKWNLFLNCIISFNI